jgi:putative membrane protein
MKKSMCLLMLLGLVSFGCRSDNQRTAGNSASPDTNSPSTSSSSKDTSSPSSTSSGSAGNQMAQSSTPNSSDEKFITDAVKGNRAEVEMGRLVAAKAADPNVRSFAKQMVKEHTEALNQLQKLAQQKNITISNDIPEDAKDMQSKLSNETGKQLDKDYMDGMVQDHQKDVQEFQTAAQNASDPDVKQWAGKMVPTLQEHLQKAQEIDQKLNSQRNPPPGA